MGRAKKWIAGILAVSLTGFGAYKGVEYLRIKNIPEVIVVSVDELVQDDYFSYDDMDTSLSGSITTNVIQNIKIDKDVIVRELLVGQGDEVRKGDLLMTIDTTLTEMELGIASLEHEKLLQNLDKARNRLYSLENGGPIEEETDSDSSDIGMYGEDDSSDSDIAMMDAAMGPLFWNWNFAAAFPHVLASDLVLEGGELIDEGEPYVEEPSLNEFDSSDADMYAQENTPPPYEREDLGNLDIGITDTIESGDQVQEETGDLLFEETTGTGEPTDVPEEITDISLEDELLGDESETDGEELFEEGLEESEEFISEDETETEVTPTPDPTPEPTPTSAPVEEIKATQDYETFYSVLGYDSRPCEGTGTEEDPFVYLCSSKEDYITLKGSFLNEMRGYDPAGNTIVNEGGYWYRLEFYLDDVHVEVSDYDASGDDEDWDDEGDYYDDDWDDEDWDDEEEYYEEPDYVGAAYENKSLEDGEDLSGEILDDTGTEGTVDAGAEGADGTLTEGLTDAGAEGAGTEGTADTGAEGAGTEGTVDTGVEGAGTEGQVDTGTAESEGTDDTGTAESEGTDDTGTAESEGTDDTGTAESGEDDDDDAGTETTDDDIGSSGSYELSGGSGSSGYTDYRGITFPRYFLIDGGDKTDTRWEHEKNGRWEPEDEERLSIVDATAVEFRQETDYDDEDYDEDFDDYDFDDYDDDDTESPGITRDEAIRDKEQEIRSLEFSIKEAEVNLAKLQKKCEIREIYSRLDGTVSYAGNPDAGTSGMDSFLRVKSKEGYFVSGQVSEMMLDRISNGTVIQCTTDMGDTFEAEVIEVADYPDSSDSQGGGFYSSGNPNASMYSFTASIPDQTLDISEDTWLMSVVLPGEAKENKNSLTINKAFVRSENGRSYVMKEKDGVLVKQYVRVGKVDSYGYTITITGGLSRHDKLAFPYTEDAVEGMKTVDGTLDQLYDFSDMML